MIDGESSSLWRQRSSMVVFSIEQALGEYVKRRHGGAPEIDNDATISECLARRDAEPTPNRRGKLSLAIAESYFDELLRISCSISVGTEDEKYILELSQLVRAINLFEVRNAVAHPNREFPENYWYRCAVVATSLPISTLNLTAVSQALQAALDNKIALPPDEWLNLASFIIPNNLPREIEHDATGLIGRRNERKKLLELIKARRSPVVVITGPGGLGKTALATQVLREYAQDFTENPEHDAIVFASLKEEALTADGVSRLEVVESMEELKEELAEDIGSLFPDVEASSFSEMCDQLRERCILLYIDNLETLLRDTPDSFSTFCDSLPREWMVIATSRVTVDGGRTLPLETLTDGDATSLGFRYADSCQVNMSSDGIERVVRASQKNPLALRLSIDLIAQGKTIEEATKKASADVVGFSFQNLVSALSPQGRGILECLFVKSPMGRGEMVSLLGLSSEEVVENARKLARTSLVRREVRGEDEEFDLNPSVRDLLRDSPAELAVRRKVQQASQEQRRVLNRHLIILRNRNVTELSEEYLPQNIAPALGNTLVRAIRYIKSNQYSYKQSNSLAKELGEFVYAYANEWRLWLWLGKIHLLIQDEITAEQYFRNAVEKAGDSPVPLLVLSEVLNRSHQFKEAKECTDLLLEKGYDSSDDGEGGVSARLWYCRLRGLLELGDYDEILTVNSEGRSERTQCCIQLFQAEALARRASSWHSDPNSDVSEALVRAMKLIQLVVSRGHYQKSLLRLIPYVCREVKHYLNILQADANQESKLLRILKVFSKFIALTLDSDVLDNAIRDEVVSVIVWAREHDNPEINARFSDPQWNIYLGIDSDLDQKLRNIRRQGFDIATIINIPPKGFRDGMVEYCFARLDDGNQIFIHRDNVEKMEFIKWIGLRVGSKIGVNGLVESRGNKLPIAGKVIVP
jgi:tetratricopeptide (TPR) repeat protein